MTDPRPSPFDELIGTKWGDFEPRRGSATLEVAEHHKQPGGIVHGGVICTLAESVASRATAFQVSDDGMQALGMSNNTTFLRPLVTGTIHAEATCRHAGRTTWVWDVECRDDEGKTGTLSRVTIAVRPQR